MASAPLFPWHPACLRSSVPASISLLCSSLLPQVVIMELLDHKPLLTGGYKAVLHIHSSERRGTARGGSWDVVARSQTSVERQAGRSRMPVASLLQPPCPLSSCPC